MQPARLSAIPMLGRYEVAGYLASGGMAEVLLGRVNGPRGFERVVVLKRILPHLARQASFVDMFLDEARIIARIHHPNVVQVHELGTVDGELFMVMEYLEGESVSSLQRRLTKRHQGLPPRLAAFIIAEACAGLHAAHELLNDEGVALDVVHRDVSPQNIFLTFDGAVKVIDFGVAKARSRDARTEAGQLKGKLEYMAPEQCKSATLDRRTDVFALGVVLYELLTQRRLFKRPSPAGTVRAILEEPIVPPSRVVEGCPRALELVCLRALERLPDKRYGSTLEMRRDLVRAIAAFPSERLPEEDLAALMQDILADRRAQKSEMLQRIREGSNVTDMPSAEADDSVEIEMEDAPREGPGPSGHDRRSRRVYAFAAVALAIALGSGVALSWQAGPKSDAAPVAATSANPGPEPVSAVHVSIESDPSGATVVIDGSSIGRTPTTLTFPKGVESRALTLRKEGFIDDQETFAADVDQKLRFPLKPVPKPRAPAASRAPNVAPPAKW